MENVCGDKHEGISGYPAILKGRYLRAEYSSELDRLADEILEVNPNLVVCLGGVALWALTGKTTITKLRGVTDTSTHTATGYKILQPTTQPTYREIGLRGRLQF
jgi:uracil-DNA glycosylase